MMMILVIIFNSKKNAFCINFFNKKLIFCFKFLKLARNFFPRLPKLPVRKSFQFSISGINNLFFFLLLFCLLLLFLA
uniref:Uncharacterized protein n=1 Tax=Panagrolaimus sp. ES5 TaxID=591445 RepID=A0AC34GNK0_9BILA